MAASRALDLDDLPEAYVFNGTRLSQQYHCGRGDEVPSSKLNNRVPSLSEETMLQIK